MLFSFCSKFLLSWFLYFSLGRWYSWVFDCIVGRPTSSGVEVITCPCSNRNSFLVIHLSWSVYMIPGNIGPIFENSIWNEIALWFYRLYIELQFYFILVIVALSPYGTNNWLHHHGICLQMPLGKSAVQHVLLVCIIYNRSGCDWGCRSPLFRTYLSEIESQFKGDPSNIR